MHCLARGEKNSGRKRFTLQTLYLHRIQFVPPFTGLFVCLSKPAVALSSRGEFFKECYCRVSLNIVAITSLRIERGTPVKFTIDRAVKFQSFGEPRALPQVFVQKVRRGEHDDVPEGSAIRWAASTVYTHWLLFVFHFEVGRSGRGIRRRLYRNRGNISERQGRIELKCMLGGETPWETASAAMMERQCFLTLR